MLYGLFATILCVFQNRLVRVWWWGSHVAAHSVRVGGTLPLGVVGGVRQYGGGIANDTRSYRHQLCYLCRLFGYGRRVGVVGGYGGGGVAIVHHHADSGQNAGQIQK